MATLRAAKLVTLVGCVHVTTPLKIPLPAPPPPAWGRAPLGAAGGANFAPLGNAGFRIGGRGICDPGGRNETLGSFSPAGGCATFGGEATLVRGGTGGVRF